MIHFVLLFSRQGKVRLQKWYDAFSDKEKKKISKEMTSTILSRKPKMSNFIEWQNMQVVYKRYASLFFAFAISKDDNELMALEIIHRYVEVLDMYFGSVCELDIIFNFEKAYYILDELVIAGEVQDTSKKSVLKQVEMADTCQEEERMGLPIQDVGLI